MYDVTVIGAGPAGLAAAATTLRYQLTTLVIAPDLAGKAAYRLRLPWMQDREVIVGKETVEQLRQQLLAEPHAARRMETVEQVFWHGATFQIITEEGGAYESRVVIVATGVTPRPLGVPGEQRLMGYGVTYSATSHAPLFAGRRVVVVGGDRRALRAADQLRVLAAHVTLVVPDFAWLSGSTVGQRLLNDEQVTVLAQHAVRAITGEAAVTGLVVATPDGKTRHIPADGVFIEYGLLAQTDFLGPLVERTPSGQIVVDDRCATRCEGLFAAGDITSAAYAEQITIAIGEGTKAGLSARGYLLEGALMQQEDPRERIVWYT